MAVFQRINSMLLAWVVLLNLTASSRSFVLDNSMPRMVERRALRYRLYSNSGKDDSSKRESETFDVDVLRQRLMQARIKVLEENLRQPPNARLSPKYLVRTILQRLWDSSNPLPDSGFRTLLRSSTRRWRDALYLSVGAPSWAPEEAVASVLGEAMARPDNQFSLLVNNNDVVGDWPPYIIDFPSDVVDYGDGTCWLECRLRSRNDRTLYVITGWQMQRRPEDGAWLVDQMDWQDFRDRFRPGIGREEWMRICG